jgi:vacuolar-type H+-ATPase subunit F/Vma7
MRVNKSSFNLNGTPDAAEFAREQAEYAASQAMVNAIHEAMGPAAAYTSLIISDPNTFNPYTAAGVANIHAYGAVAEAEHNAAIAATVSPVQRDNAMSVTTPVQTVANTQTQITTPAIVTAPVIKYFNPNPNAIPYTGAPELKNIKDNYYALVPSNIQEFVRLMNAYKVSVYDVANAINVPPATVASVLNQPDGFGGYYKTKITSATSVNNTSTSNMSPALLGAAAIAAYIIFG